MTDEGKAEESFRKHIEEDECYFNKAEINIYTNGYLDGMAEGRKEGFDAGYKKATERAYERQQDLTNTYIKDDEKIKQLEKEKEELKSKNETLNELFDDFQRFFDRLRCCGNCENKDSNVCSGCKKEPGTNYGDKWECGIKPCK